MQVERHAAHIALVHELGRGGLQRNRVAEPVRRRDRVGRAGDDRVPGYRDTEARARARRPRAGRATRPSGWPARAALHDRTRAVDVEVVEHGHPAHGAPPPIGEIGDPPERVRGGFGERERRNRPACATGAVVAAQLGGDAGAPEEARDHGLVAGGRRRRSRSRARDVGRTGHERRDEDHEQRVDSCRRAGRRAAPARTARRSRPRRDRPDCARAASRRDERPQRVLRRRAELGHLEPRARAGVGGQDARAAGVAHDRDAAARRQGLVREHHRASRTTRRACRRGSRRPGGRARRPRRRAKPARPCATTRRGARRPSGRS